MCRDIGVQMFTFGKGTKVSGRKYLISRRWFDGLVEVRSFEVETPAVASYKSPINNFVDDFSYPEPAKKTLRENRHLNRCINEQKKRSERSWWWYDTPSVAKKKVNKKLGQVYIEADLDGEEKLTCIQAREWEHGRSDQHSWKNSAKASKQWARHKPVSDVPWAMAEEMSAGYLQREREIEAYNEYIEKMLAAADNETDMYEDEVYFAAVRNLDDLEERYWFGRWNHNTIGRESDGWYDIETDTQLWYQNAIAA